MSLPLYVDPSPQTSTPCSCIAWTSIVPVTARPSGVVLKYVLPPDETWNAPHRSATSPSWTSCGRQSTRIASSAPTAFARAGTLATSASSYWPRSAVSAYGTAPFSRIHATATVVSSPPEKAIPTRSPTGSEVRTRVTGRSVTGAAAGGWHARLTTPSRGTGSDTGRARGDVAPAGR